jgi:8-oxo-dGTP pyrophosphatase MutT (NUDIX family)
MSQPAGAMRALHTLKGGARLAGAMRLGELVHRLESRIEQLTSASSDAPAAVSDIEPLLGRSDALRRHSGQVALPGGRAEPGETPVQTALREAEEEVGLAPRFVRPIGLGDLYRTGTGYAITPVVALIMPGFELTPDPGEVAEIFETPFRFLMDPSNHERKTWVDAEGEQRPYYAMPHKGRMIWGVTAGLFRSLYERLFED